MEDGMTNIHSAPSKPGRIPMHGYVDLWSWNVILMEYLGDAVFSEIRNVDADSHIKRK
jgi:hypothetical protein